MNLSKDNKVRYDWVLGQEGYLLAPDWSKGVRQQVVVGVMHHDTLRILYEAGRLYGRALDEAKVRYGDA